MLSTLRALLNTLSVLIVSHIYPNADISLKMGLAMFVVEMAEIISGWITNRFPEILAKFSPRINTIDMHPRYNPINGPECFNNVYVDFSKFLLLKYHEIFDHLLFVGLNDEAIGIMHTTPTKPVNVYYKGRMVTISLVRENSLTTTSTSTTTTTPSATNDANGSTPPVIRISAKLTVDEIKAYVGECVKQVATRIVEHICLYFYWNNVPFAENPLQHIIYIRTSKSLKTLALAKNVLINFVDDLKVFTKSKDSYEKREKPWRRGYLLYGPPGTGKTSLVKYVAFEHQYNIVNAIVSGGIYLQIGSDYKQKIILVEDFHAGMLRKCDLGKDDAKSNSNKCEKLGLGELLNIMDGVQPLNNTIFIFTTNDETIFKDPHLAPLFRPGRIDKIIKIDYCDIEQINELIKQYAEETPNKMKKVSSIHEKIKITPAQVTNILQTINGNVEELMKFKDYIEGKTTKFLDIFNMETGCRNAVTIC